MFDVAANGDGTFFSLTF